MTSGEREIDLTEAIAEAYVKNMKVRGAVKNAQTQLQIMNVLCGSGDACSDCVGLFEPRWNKGEEGAADKGYYCGTGSCPGDARIDAIRDGVCRGPCVCSLDAVQNSTVTFDMSGRLEPGDIDSIAAETQRILKTKYGDDFRPSKDQIVSILSGKLEQIIDQVASVVQIIEVSNGQVQNVTMEAAVNVVMQALASMSIKEIRNSVHTIIAELKTFVERTISQTLKDILAMFLVQWIILGSLVVVLAVTALVLYVVRRLRK